MKSFLAAVLILISISASAQTQPLSDDFRSGFRQRMLAEQGGGDEGKAQTSAIGQLLPGEVLAHLGVDDGGGQFLARSLGVLGMNHGVFLFFR